MKKKKIVFCLDRSFTNRDYQRFGCAYLEKLGYEVEVWNIDADRYKRVEIPQGYYQGPNVLDVSMQKARARVGRYPGAVFVILTNGLEKLLFHKAKRNYHVIMYLSAGSLGYGLTAIPKKHLSKAADSLWQTVFSELKSAFVKRMASQYTQSAPDYYILNTHQCAVALPPNVEKENVHYIHTGDYDRYLEYKQSGISVSEEFILYIDSGFGLVDIDIVIEGYRDPWQEKPEIHCRKRNRIFETLEKHYGLPVVIAGHPHTDYSNADFGGRKILFDKTCELVAKAKFVILQWSTAASYTMLFKKSLMILMDDDVIQNGVYHKWMYANYKLFDLKVCNMDREECRDRPWEFVNVIDDDKRKKYIRTFIKEDETPELLSYEMLEQIIKKT